MDVKNIITVLVVSLTLCKQILAQEKSAVQENHEESLHSAYIDNSENKFRKDDALLKKSKFEKLPPKYKKNEYVYTAETPTLSNAIEKDEIAKNTPKILLKIASIPKVSSENITKKEVEQVFPKTINKTVVHLKKNEANGLGTQTAQHLEKSASNLHNHEEIDNFDNKYSSFPAGNADGRIPQRNQKNIKNCRDKKSVHHLNSDSVEKGTQLIKKVEPKIDSVNRHAHKKKDHLLFFEEIDTDVDRSKVNNVNEKAIPVSNHKKHVYKAESNKTSSSPNVDDFENTLKSPIVKLANIETIDQKLKNIENVASNNSKKSLPVVSTDHYLKLEQPIKDTNNNSDLNTDFTLLKINDKLDYYEDNNFDPSSRKDNQEKANVLELKFAVNDKKEPIDDFVIKTYNVNEVEPTHKNTDEVDNQKYTCCNDKAKTENFNYHIINIIIPKDILEPLYRYPATAPYTQIYGYNYQTHQYDQNSMPQQYNYYKYPIKQPQNNPYRTYSQEYWGQNYNPGLYYASLSDNYDRFKPDYTDVAPSFKYPFENQLKDIVNPIKLNTINDRKQSKIYPPIIYDYNDVKYPKDYLDKLWRTWQNTETHMKKPKNVASLPCEKCSYRNLVHTKFN